MFSIYNTSVIRQKGESQNWCFKKTKHVKFSEKTNLSNPLICTRTCAYQGVRNVRFFEKFDVFCFLETPVLRFALLPYYRRTISCPIWSIFISGLYLRSSFDLVLLLFLLFISCTYISCVYILLQLDWLALIGLWIHSSLYLCGYHWTLKHYLKTNLSCCWQYFQKSLKG